MNKHIKKLPFAAGGGATGTNDKYRHTWVIYGEAVAAAEKVGAAGVGFVISEGYFFLDIDHADKDDPRVQTMLSRFDSYAEYSVSGNGLHIYGKVDLRKLPIAPDKNGKPRLDKQFYMKNPNNGIELYIGGLTNRFAAFTGNAVADLPLQDCTTAVLTTLDKDMRKTEKVKYSAARDGDRAIFDIVCNLSKQKNGEKFKKLYYSGDYSDYGSHSEADLALCTIFAFRTVPDPELIDELFRSSALMRDKWEREDYRTATIDAAIRACNGQFHRSKMDHPWLSCEEAEHMQIIKEWRLNQLREQYPVGTRVEMIHMDDPYNRKLVPGCQGTVRWVDDMGTIHVSWDCGSSLGLIPGEDEFKKN